MPELPKEDWWSPQQLDVVEDRSRRWVLRQFEPSDTIAFPFEGQTIARRREPDEAVPSGARVVPGGWDHVHCAVCWQKISQLSGSERSGYTDDRDWVCRTCYERYILPRVGAP